MKPLRSVCELILAKDGLPHRAFYATLPYLTPNKVKLSKNQTQQRLQMLWTLTSVQAKNEDQRKRFVQYELNVCEYNM